MIYCYKCSLICAKKKLKLAFYNKGIWVLYIYMIPSLAFHQRRLVERRVLKVGREAGREAGSAAVSQL